MIWFLQMAQFSTTMSSWRVHNKRRHSLRDCIETHPMPTEKQRSTVMSVTEVNACLDEQQTETQYARGRTFLTSKRFLSILPSSLVLPLGSLGAAVGGSTSIVSAMPISS